jgi:hypothetical protein
MCQGTNACVRIEHNFMFRIWFENLRTCLVRKEVPHHFEVHKRLCKAKNDPSIMKYSSDSNTCKIKIIEKAGSHRDFTHQVIKSWRLHEELRRLQTVLALRILRVELIDNAFTMGIKESNLDLPIDGQRSLSAYLRLAAGNHVSYDKRTKLFTKHNWPSEWTIISRKDRYREIIGSSPCCLRQKIFFWTEPAKKS